MVIIVGSPSGFLSLCSPAPFIQPLEGSGAHHESVFFG
ncbi:hypothetical protein LptCag_0902 [Leptospirillum ferriphilum]|uniref:Uncharacterized protein n=1 Tax=Leptospirillum ferriphilum TaxID=178606 RepID=A0A094WBM9_9BACT|nr:hypothetical protein LptCag_0902 [Leptospirillum ferriphilum]